MGRASTLGTRTTAVLVFTALLVLGVTTSSLHRNGWTTFIVLCIGGITLMFLVGAASLWVLRGWSRWGALGKALSGVGMLVLGVVVMLSYEMHWAAVLFAIILLAFAGRAIWPHRLILIASSAAPGWPLCSGLGHRLLPSPTTVMPVWRSIWAGQS